MPSRSVAIIQEHVYHYRVAFYRHLKLLLDAEGVAFHLCYDQRTTPCHELDREEWTSHTPTWRLGKVTWQKLPKEAKKSSLAIFQQQVRYPANLLRILTSRFHGQKTAFWGHGSCFAEGWEHRRSEKFKAWISTKVDHWFAYNAKSADVVRGLGYPEERITIVRNAVDTTALREAMESFTDCERNKLKTKLGFQSENICVFTGSYSENKRLGFLIEASILIRKKIPDFHLLLIGSGHDETTVESAAREHAWIHSLGPMDGTDKIPCWAISNLLLMPGLVGLVVIDSFAAGLPLVTTDFPNHSHEIDYLMHGENGWIVPDYRNPEAYADKVCVLLGDPEERSRIAANCLRDSSLYSIEQMACNFYEGAAKALGPGTPK